MPFGGGSRTCIGMRFGQAEIALIARGILERYRLELQPGYELDIRQAPTISPRHGLPMRVRAAQPAAVAGRLTSARYGSAYSDSGGEVAEDPGERCRRSPSRSRRRRPGIAFSAVVASAAVPMAAAGPDGGTPGAKDAVAACLDTGADATGGESERKTI